MIKKALVFGTLLLLLLGAAGAAALYRYERQMQAFYAAPARTKATVPPADSTEVVVLGTVHFPTPLSTPTACTTRWKPCGRILFCSKSTARASQKCWGAPRWRSG